MSPSVQPLSASEQKTQLADFERSVLQAVKQRGPQEENPIILPLRAEDLRSLTQTLERNRMTEEVGGPIEGPPGTFTLRTPQGDQVSLSIPDAPPGWTQKGFAAVQAEREIRDNMKEEAVRVLGLRQKYDSLQTATEDGLRLMETNPTAGRELLEDVDLAGSSSAYTKLFRDQIGGARQAVMFALGRAGVGGLVGYTQGETPEERLRNAALVAGIGAAASPALARAGGRKLSEFFTKKPPQATTPVEAIAQELGKKARAITDEMLGTREKIGDYTQAHEVADQAWKHLDELRARAHEIDPNNRLYKVVDQIVFPEGGPDSAKYKGTIRGAGQVLQRLSALAQELNRRADAGDVDAARLRDILYPEMTAGQRVMNFWRGSLVGKIATQVRNAGDQGAILGSTILDRLFTGTIAGLRQGKPLQGAQQALTLGSVAARRFKDSIAQAVHLAAKEPDTLDTILNHHDEFSQRLLEKPEGLQGPLGTYLRTINKFNEVQENWYRRAHAEAELINGLRRAGIDPDHAFRNPGMIPDDVLEKSLSEALKGTMQGQPRGTSLGFLTSMGSNPSNALLREVSDIFRRNPVLYGIAPFPRYMANRLQYVVDHSPVGLAKLATENTRRGMLTQRLTDNEEVLASLSAGKTPLTGEKLEAAIQRAEQNIQQAKRDLVYVDTPAETIGKVATGLTLSLAAGVALRHPDIAGEHWWEVKAGDTRLDMRPFSTMAGFMFLGELGRQYVTQGEITMSASDIAQGLAVLGTRAGIGLTLMDMVSGRGDVSWEGVSNLLADLAGMFGAGFFNPVSQTKDIAATIEGMTSEGIPPEAIQREFRDDWQTRLLGPTLNQFPFASRTLPERASSTSADPVHFPYPLAHFFGANISTPNPVEQEIGRLGIPREAVYPRVENRADARAIAERMGPVVEREGQRLINDVRFRSQRDAGREELLRDLLAKARGYGERQLGGTDPQRLRDIKMNRLPEHRQELLRERMLRR
jgi:hypothetical protein